MTAQVLAGESLVRYRLWKVSQDRIVILIIEKANFNAGCLTAVSITVNDYVIMAIAAHAHWFVGSLVNYGKLASPSRSSLLTF